MTGSHIASLFYLILLGGALAGYFIAANRQDLGRTARQAALWGLIFIGAIAAAGLWTDVRDDVMPRQALTTDGTGLQVPQSFDGHYRLQMGLNGEPVTFIVDTGATDLVLSQQDAARVGIEPESLAYTGRAHTANGTVPMAQVILDEVDLAGEIERDVPATVNGGEMEMSLLGMSYLQRFGRISIEDETLTLTP